jgi:transcription initiation factor TFIIE subunit alpha
LGAKVKKSKKNIQKSKKEKRPTRPNKKSSIKRSIKSQRAAAATAKKKNIIIRKKEVKVKTKKKTVKKEEEHVKKTVVLSKEDIEFINEILSKPLIRQTLVDLGGENAIAIVKSFDRSMSDEELSKKLKLKISDVRATLNRLHNEGLVVYERDKDSETGWYSYSWYLNKERMEKWALEQLGRIGNDGHDGRDYYFCPSCGKATMFSFEDALEKNFRCEICNSQLEFVDEEKKEEFGLTMQIRKR